MGWGGRLRGLLALVLMGLLAVSLVSNLASGGASFTLPAEVELFQTLYPIRFPSIDVGFRGSVYFLPTLKEGAELWKDYGLVGVNDMLITRRYLDYPYIAWTGSYRLVNDDSSRPFTSPLWAIYGHLALTSWKGGDVDNLVFHTEHNDRFSTLVYDDPVAGKTVYRDINILTGLVINSVERLERSRNTDTEAWVLLGSITQEARDILGLHFPTVCYVGLTWSTYRPGIVYEEVIREVKPGSGINCLQLFDGVAADVNGDGYDEVVAVGMGERDGRLVSLVLILEVSGVDVKILDYNILLNEAIWKDCGTLWLLTVDLISLTKVLNFVTAGACFRVFKAMSYVDILLEVFSVTPGNPPTINKYTNPGSYSIFSIDTEGNMTLPYNSLVTDSIMFGEDVFLSATAVLDNDRSGGALIQVRSDFSNAPSEAYVNAVQLQYIDGVDFWSLALYPHAGGDRILLAGRWSKNHTNLIAGLRLDGSDPVYQNYPPYPRNSVLQGNTRSLGIFEVGVEDVDLDGELEIVAAGLVERNSKITDADILDKPGGGPVLLPFLMVIGRTSITTTSTSVETTTETTTKTRVETSTLFKRTTKTKTISYVTTETRLERVTETLRTTFTEHVTETMTEKTTVVEKVAREVLTTRTTYETRTRVTGTTTTIPTTVTRTTTLTETPILVPEPAPAAPGILEKPPLDLIWIIPAFALGLLLPLPILLRRGPRVRIIYSEPSGLHERAREIASNLLWMAETHQLPKLTTRIQPSKKEGILEVFVGRKKVYSTTDGWGVDPLMLSQEILRFLRK